MIYTKTNKFKGINYDYKKMDNKLWKIKVKINEFKYIYT